MKENESAILKEFLLQKHLDSLDDGRSYKYLQLKVIGGDRSSVEGLLNILCRLFDGRKSKLHQCSLDIDPEVRVVSRGWRCWRCYLKIYLPKNDPCISYEETIASLKAEISHLEATIASLYSRLEAMKTHRNSR